MNQPLPDRLSIDRNSPYFDKVYRKLGVKLDGFERPGDVREYCVSEGWIIVQVRKSNGKWERQGDEIVTKKLTGVVEPFLKFEGVLPAVMVDTTDHQAHIDRAEEKRQRKAAKLREQEARRG